VEQAQASWRRASAPLCQKLAFFLVQNLDHNITNARCNKEDRAHGANEKNQCCWPGRCRRLQCTEELPDGGWPRSTMNEARTGGAHDSSLSKDWRRLYRARNPIFRPAPKRTADAGGHEEASDACLREGRVGTRLV
jgi:hypothetical protein